MIPIHKTGEHLSGNYWLISLLSTFDNVLEIIMHTRLSDVFLEKKYNFI